MRDYEPSTGYFRYVTLNSEIRREGVLIWLDYETEWFKRRFSMFQDILRESPIYQEIVEQGREEERQRRIQEHRIFLIRLIQLHFPELEALAKQKVDGIEDPDVLSAMNFKLLAAQRVEEARLVLLSVDRGGTKD